MRVLSVIAEETEALRLAPASQALSGRRGSLGLIATAGRPGADAVSAFGLRPDATLSDPRRAPSRTDALAMLLAEMGALLRDLRPDALLIASDGPAAMAAALAGADAEIPVVQIDADAPRPPADTARARALLHLAALRCAPNERARWSLLEAGAPEDGVVATGSPAADGLRRLAARLDLDPAAGTEIADALDRLEPSRPLILLLGAPGAPSARRALDRLARRGDLQLGWIPDPAGASADPLAARRFPAAGPNALAVRVALMRRAALIVTGAPDRALEAAALGAPALILSDAALRPEAAAAGAERAVGADAGGLAGAIDQLLSDPVAWAEMAAAPCPFGDADAAERVADLLIERFAATAPSLRRAG